MLTYTFSTREKILLAILAIAGIIVLWYQFVFTNIQGQIANIDSQIASTQDQLIVLQANAASLANMQKTVEEYQAKGATPVLVPSYDNTQNLMAYLNGVLSSTQGYSIAFDNPELSNEDGTIHRSGTVSFTSASYEDARSVVQAIARGPYPCQIDALGITDGTVGRSGSSANTVTSNVQLTFFETPTKDVAAPTGDNAPKGQDLSQMSNWNK